MGVAAAVFLPAVAFAQTAPATGIENVLISFARSAAVVATYLVPAAFSLGVAYFFYGMAKYILHAGDEGAKESGKQIMIYGVLAMFVMVGVFGIINLINTTLGISNTQPIQGGTIVPPNIAKPN